MQSFLQDFGVHTAQRTDERPSSRADGRQPFVHGVLRGAGNVGVRQGIGCRAQSLADLRPLVESTGSKVLKIGKLRVGNSHWALDLPEDSIP